MRWSAYALAAVLAASSNARANPGVDSPGSPRLSFLNESRRVSNDRMLKHLGVVLKYADVEAGIRASFPRG